MYQEMEPAYQPMGPRGHSGFGIASFCIAFLSGLLVLGCCGLIYWIGVQAQQYPYYNPSDPSSVPEELSYASFGWMALCGCSLLSTLIGVIFGIIGVAQKDVNKVFGILGLVFNGLILLFYVGIILLFLFFMVLGMSMVGAM